ncbi:rCG49961 [Rattus norvegicus]|uniref:RCG49961 n=1 Tax=Rattus norvegicus TaxID=10116 RepID=A6JVM4_RAT|nr:rCG49961 [Rattus norvegicus]
MFHLIFTTSKNILIFCFRMLVMLKMLYIIWTEHAFGDITLKFSSHKGIRGYYIK